ncbi:hypothetical protein [Peterkaempfera griseoplana]|uniref:hypothetical protein n=1 Tax=Peterkaempfera griseoplana TaxID=66896 RepID=UPI0006E3AC5D|nr:hypothetical protein [Peterkaempfera griseoplana]
MTATDRLRGILAAHMTGIEIDALIADIQAETGKVTSTGGAITQPADFYQPGRTYSGPYGWRFRADTITTHPQDGERTALGWRYWADEWEPYACGEADWEIGQFASWTGSGEAGDR